MTEPLDTSPSRPDLEPRPTFSSKTSGWGYYPDCEAGFDDNISDEKAAAEEEAASKHGYLYLLVYNFSPVWFPVTMGTGIVPVILHNQFLQFRGLDIIVLILFGLNAFIFLVFTVILLLQYAIWPRKFKEMLYNPVHSLFIGALPMGLSTLINLSVYMIVPKAGKGFIMALWVIWWIDAAMSAASIVLVSFLIMHKHPAELQGVTAAWVLPIVPGIVSAAAGANVAGILQNDTRATTTILACYVLIGLSFPTGFMVAVVYFSRLLFHKLPPRPAIPSTFLPLGLSAQTSLGFIELGKVSKTVFTRTGFLGGQATGDSWYAAGILTGLLLWAFAMVWFSWAISSICLGRFPFSMGWWAFTFPIGVLATATIALGNEFGSEFFKVFGSMLAFTVTLAWAIIFVKTLKAFVTGEFFR
ncbi:hypothetical protein BP6252_11645 [Coleophoma cylindrospora]|uniref:Sulfite efflux pump SSU1 n=1 Tax=Coleophoma cylindrospora TaxID=1849047 RepID=A0A3D8QK80_9HELO|nr:hypothetical protein BP6252_11645 [Coleophoma cylindrospora]